ncbi:MAG: hypothetical protein LBT33_11085 [Spirochaetia bacterium]|jgi:hypothetical protein|nr:hypothetical protein [Spirochaetia bacterium]
MKNKLSDLNDHLFAEIERLGDEELIGEKLAEEIGRAQSIAGVAEKIVANAALVLKAHQISIEWESFGKKKLPPLLE